MQVLQVAALCMQRNSARKCVHTRVTDNSLVSGHHVLCIHGLWQGALQRGSHESAQKRHPPPRTRDTEQPRRQRRGCAHPRGAGYAEPVAAVVCRNGAAEAAVNGSPPCAGQLPMRWNASSAKAEKKQKTLEKERNKQELLKRSNASVRSNKQESSSASKHA